MRLPEAPQQGRLSIIEIHTYSKVGLWVRRRRERNADIREAERRVDPGRGRLLWLVRRIDAGHVKLLKDLFALAQAEVMDRLREHGRVDLALMQCPNGASVPHAGIFVVPWVRYCSELAEELDRELGARTRRGEAHRSDDLDSGSAVRKVADLGKFCKFGLLVSDSVHSPRVATAKRSPVILVLLFPNRATP